MASLPPGASDEPWVPRSGSSTSSLFDLDRDFQPSQQHHVRSRHLGLSSPSFYGRSIDEEAFGPVSTEDSWSISSFPAEFTAAQIVRAVIKPDESTDHSYDQRSTQDVNNASNDEPVKLMNGANSRVPIRNRRRSQSQASVTPSISASESKALLSEILDVLNDDRSSKASTASFRSARSTSSRLRRHTGRPSAQYAASPRRPAGSSYGSVIHDSPSISHSTRRHPSFRGGLTYPYNNSHPVRSSPHPISQEKDNALKSGLVETPRSDEVCPKGFTMDRGGLFGTEPGTTTKVFHALRERARGWAADHLFPSPINSAESPFSDHNPRIPVDSTFSASLPCVDDSLRGSCTTFDLASRKKVMQHSVNSTFCHHPESISNTIYREMDTNEDNRIQGPINILGDCLGQSTGIQQFRERVDYATDGNSLSLRSPEIWKIAVCHAVRARNSTSPSNPDAGLDKMNGLEVSKYPT